MTFNLRELSTAQGGAGVSLKNKRALTELGVALSIGQSPGPGTGCSVFLATNKDTAYDGALVTFYVKQFGRQAEWAQITISPADVAAQDVLVYTTTGFAADYWDVSVQLTGATTPATPLENPPLPRSDARTSLNRRARSSTPASIRSS